MQRVVAMVDQLGTKPMESFGARELEVRFKTGIFQVRIKPGSTITLRYVYEVGWFKDKHVYELSW